RRLRGCACPSPAAAAVALAARIAVLARVVVADRAAAVAVTAGIAARIGVAAGMAPGTRMRGRARAVARRLVYDAMVARHLPVIRRPAVAVMDDDQPVVAAIV